MAQDVFISYSHIDKPIADAICANLENAGMRCWIAPRDIAPGLDWPRAISNAIVASRVMVLVFSSNSNSSNDVSRELILAANNNLIIIPFKIDNTTPEPGKQYYLARTHWLDARNPPTREQINKLVGYVKSYISGGGSARTDQPASVAKLPSAEGIQPPPVVTASPSPPIKVETTGYKKGTKLKSIWIYGILLMLAIIGGSIFAIRSFGQVTPTTLPFFTPTSVTPTFTIPTATPTLKITPAKISLLTATAKLTTAPTKISIPTATATPLPTWVTEFAEPILAAIANRSPNFQDDFAYGSGLWQAEDWCTQRVKYVEGELIMTNCHNLKQPYNYKDFVVEFEARFFPGAASDSKWDFNFKDVGGASHQILIYFNGDVTINFGISFANAAYPGNLSSHILVIGRGSEFAIYLNNQPLFYFTSSYLTYGDFEFNADDTILAIDNFKIWNLANISVP